MSVKSIRIMVVLINQILICLENMELVEMYTSLHMELHIWFEPSYFMALHFICIIQGFNNQALYLGRIEWYRLKLRVGHKTDVLNKLMSGILIDFTLIWEKWFVLFTYRVRITFSIGNCNLFSNDKMFFHSNLKY